MMPMIATTISSSMRVKPFDSRIFISSPLQKLESPVHRATAIPTALAAIIHACAVTYVPGSPRDADKNGRSDNACHGDPAKECQPVRLNSRDEPELHVRLIV